MGLQQQLHWSGLWIIVASILMNSMRIAISLGYRNPAIQAVYMAGFTGLVFACTIIHLAQAKRSGLLGLIAFLICVLSLAYSNIANFLELMALIGTEEAQTTFQAVRDPVMRPIAYGSYFGLTLLGISVARAGVLPRWSGAMLAIGVAIGLPAAYTIEFDGALSLIFSIGGSILTMAGLAWMGWALWSGKGWDAEAPGLSSFDRAWGAPFVILTGLLLAVDAAANMFGGLSLASGLTHLLSYTTLLLTSYLLYAGQGDRARGTGFAGFVFTQTGAALYLIPACLIVAQLAGIIDNNRMLMASWQDIPVGRIASYMTILGMFLFGVEAIRSEIYSQASGWLVITGIAVSMPFLFTIQDYFLGIFWVLGAILEGIGVGWMGWALWRNRTDRRAMVLKESTT